MATENLKFLPLQLKVPANVWSWIGQHKLDHLKLDTGPFPVGGLLLPAAFHRGSGQDSAVELQAGVHRASQETADSDGSCVHHISCIVHAFNQLEHLADSDQCNTLLAQVGQDLRGSVTSGDAFESPAVLWRGLLLVYADLKRHRYSYCAAFPYLKLPQSCKVKSCQPLATAFPDAAPAMIKALAQEQDWPVLISVGGDVTKPQVAPLKNLTSILAEGDGNREWPEGLAVALLDTSSNSGVLGGGARNVLALLAHHFPAATVPVLALRAAHGALSAEHSQALTVQLPAGMHAESAPLLGWESSRAHPEKPGVRTPVAKVADLAAVLDPATQAAQAVALNLKLMRWRAAPALDLDAMASTRCLILGCGTLGCEVARTLVGWGVQNLTLVDNGRVAFSNPARQSLFQVEDCVNGGAPKAEAAAAALRRIAPTVDVTAVPLTIRMPGHPCVSTEVDQAVQDVEQLDALVRAADAVFLLTDSRESRWLPTLLAAAHSTPLLNAALGFDSWVAMRHGVRASAAAAATDAAGDAASTSTAPPPAEQPAARLGCYFCNDVVAPANSLAGRSMDEQCTVVRPGVARVAAATAVEMLAALVQHPQGAAAPATAAGAEGAVLGGVPHMLRGSLMGFDQTHMSGSANPVCSACCDRVLEAYREHGAAFVLQVLQDDHILETVSGLEELRLRSLPPEGGAGDFCDDEDDWEAL